MGKNSNKAELYGVTEDGSMIKLEEIPNMTTFTSTQNPPPFIVMGTPENRGAGGNGANKYTASTGEGFECNGDCDECEFAEDCEEGFELNLDNVEGQIAVCDDEYYGIFSKAHISNWAKQSTGEDKELYAFTREDLVTLGQNRSYLTDLLKSVVHELDVLLEDYNDSSYVPEVERILRSGDATIVFWDDGDKTIVKKAADEADSDYIAFTAALGKKIFGSNSKLSRFIKSKIEYQKPKEKKPEASEADKKAIDGMLWTSTSYTKTDNSHNPEGNVDAYN